MYLFSVGLQKVVDNPLPPKMKRVAICFHCGSSGQWVAPRVMEGQSACNGTWGIIQPINSTAVAVQEPYPFLLPNQYPSYTAAAVNGFFRTIPHVPLQARWPSIARGATP